MKNLRSFLITLVIILIQSAVISAILWVCQWLLSFTGICEKPALSKLFWGGLGVYALLFIYSVVVTVVTLFRCYKDPVFKDAHLRTGISWKNYKKFAEKNE